MLFHIGCSMMHAVNTEVRVVLSDLLLADLGDVFDWAVPRVFCKGERDLFEGVAEGTHGVLFNSLDFVSRCGNCNRAGELSGTTTSNNVTVLDHIAHNADSVMEATAGLVTDGLGTTTDEHSDCARLGALFNQNDLVTASSEVDLLDVTGMS